MSDKLPWDVGIKGWQFCPHCDGEGGFWVSCEEGLEDVWINCDCNSGFIQSSTFIEDSDESEGQR